MGWLGKLKHIVGYIFSISKWSDGYYEIRLSKFKDNSFRTGKLFASTEIISLRILEKFIEKMKK